MLSTRLVDLGIFGMGEKTTNRFQRLGNRCHVTLLPFDETLLPLKRLGE
jgi:hypothetical protein